MYEDNYLQQEKFPPNIYYKIFTYRPVTDVNSFAPRDYTVSNWAAPGATVKNSKVDNPNDREGEFSIKCSAICLSIVRLGTWHFD